MSPITLNISNFKSPLQIHHSKFPNNAITNISGGAWTHKRNYYKVSDINQGKIAGAILGKNKNYIFQIEPGRESLDESVLVNKLYEIFKSAEEIPEKVSAFIYGGIKSFENSNFAKISCDTYSQLANAFESLGVSVSMLCGKNPQSLPDDMIVLNNGIYIRNKEINSIIENNPGMNDNEIKEILESKYSDVELDNININVFDRVV